MPLVATSSYKLLLVVVSQMRRASHTAYA